MRRPASNVRHTVTPAVTTEQSVLLAPKISFSRPTKNVSRLVPRVSSWILRHEVAIPVTNRVRPASDRARVSADFAEIIPSITKGRALTNARKDSWQI